MCSWDVTQGMELGATAQGCIGAALVSAVSAVLLPVPTGSHQFFYLPHSVTTPLLVTTYQQKDFLCCN